MKIDNLPVKDAHKGFCLFIRPIDVKKGSQKNPDACAAALACIHAVKGCTAAKVHISTTYLKVGKAWVRYKTSPALRTEIVAFDRGGKFEPGEYVLSRVPNTEIKRRGKAHSYGAPKHGRPGHLRPKHHVLTGVRKQANSEFNK